MKMLNPFKWASSMLIAKFLSPYFKNIDENNINIGFWKGDITLRKLELSRDFLMFGDLAIDVEGSMVEEVRIGIPWKSLQSEPITIEIKGIKLCLSQEVVPQKNLDQKEDLVNEWKKEALKSFDKMIRERAKEEAESQNEGNGGYFMNLINNIAENITVKIHDVELMYIFHISSQEIVKFGVNIESFEIKPCAKEQFDNSLSKDIHILKLIKLSKLSVYFDVYDESFLKKYQEEATNSVQHALSNLHHYILNDTTINMDVEIKMGNQLDIKPHIKVSPIFLHFNQKQIKFLLLFLEKFTELQSPRPKIRPTDKKSVSLWWKYAVKRVMEEESISSKIFNMSFNTYVHAEKYKILYMKSCINPQGLSPLESNFMERFEMSSSLTHIIKIRNVALDQIRLMNFRLRKGDSDERKNAETWFKKFDKGFMSTYPLDLNLEKKKVENASMNMKLTFMIESISVLIRENDIIDSLRNLQSHVHFFKSTLGNQEHLKNKVLDHIKKNFVKALKTQVNQAREEIDSVTKGAFDISSRPVQGNYRSELTLKDYMDYITNKDYAKENLHKFLLCLSIEDISGECRKEKMDVLANLKISKILGRDLLAVGHEIKNFLEISSDLKVSYSTRTIKLMNFRGIHNTSSVHHFQLVHLNVEIPKVNLYVYKPFIERISSLAEFLTFDIDRDRWKTTFNVEKNSLLYDTILKKKESIHQQMNLSVTIQKINVYVPTDYVKTSYMLVLHLDQLKLYKREHENNNEKNVIAIADTKTEHEFFSQDFQPLIITIQNIRGLIVNDFQWEVIENPFLHRSPKEAQEKTYISTLFEILHIHLSIEKFTQIHTLENGQEVFPSQKSITIKLPLVILNLSTKNIYILMSLIQQWTGPTGEIKLNGIKNVVQKKREDEDESFFSAGENKDSHGPKTSKTDTKDAKLAKTKVIDHHLTYETNIRKILDGLVLSQLDLICEGIVINVKLDEERVCEPETMAYHRHSLFSVYLHTVTFRIITKYFESRYSIAVKQFLVEYHDGCDDRRVDQRAKAIFEGLLLEEAESDKIFQDESRLEPPELKSRTKSAFTPKNDQPMCAKCAAAKNNLILNFLNIDQAPDLLIHVSIIDNEYLHIVNQEFIQTEINILLSDLTLIANPQAFKQLRMILDYAQLYAKMQHCKFADFMRREAFWPEVDIDDHIATENPQEASQNEDKGIPLSQIKVGLPSLNVVFLHQKNPIYLLNLGDISVVSSTYLRDSGLRVSAKSITLYNTSKIAGPHNQIISTLEGNDFDVLTIQMKSLGKFQALVKNYGTWMGIRLQGVKIVFLKSKVNEFVEYLMGNLMASFSTQLEQLKTEQVKSPDERSDMKLELTIVNSIIEVFRNSLASESLLFYSKKIGLWSCGKWGQDPGHLINEGTFEEELNNANESPENTEDFQDAVNGNEEEADMMAAEEIYKRNQASPPSKTQRSVATSEDIYRLQIVELKVKTKERVENTLFISFAQDSLVLDIILEDKEYLKKNPQNNLVPMKLVIKIPSLKVFAYEPDFDLLMKFFQENLGESPQTVVSSDPPPPVTDKSIWLIVDMQADESLIKTFNGTREGLQNKFKKEALESKEFLRDFIFKNPSSLGLLTLEKMHFKMMMRKNGGKVMILNVKQLDIYDIRHKTKVGKEFRRILGAAAKKLKLEEDTTSMTNPANFIPENYENFDIDLQRSAVDQTINNNADTKFTEKDTNRLKLTEIIVHRSGTLDKHEIEKQEKQGLIQNGKKTEKEENVGLGKKISGFFKRMTTCCRRKRKEENNPYQKTDEAQKKTTQKSGFREAFKRFRKGDLAEKSDSLAFNPAEEPNAFVIDKNKDHQFLTPSDKPILELIDRNFTLGNTRREVLEQEKRLDIDFKERKMESYEAFDQNFADNTSKEDQSYAEEIKFIINDESEIKQPTLRDAEYFEWNQESELYLYFEADPAGEKNIYISLNNKTLIVAKDFLMSLVNFFKKPFTESIDPDYMKKMYFNNFPPMRLKIALNNLSVLLLSSFERIENNNALVLFANVIYNQEFLGDSGFGPGSSGMAVDLWLKKLFFINASDIFGKVVVPNQKVPEEAQSNISLIEPFKIIFSTIYSVPYYLGHRTCSAKYDLKLELKNQEKLTNNFILSAEQLNLIQKIVTNVLASTVDVKEEQVEPFKKPAGPFQDPEVISTYMIKINRFKINLIKMVQGMELAHITLTKVIMRAVQEKEKTVMKAKMTLDVKYFNRRKISFEPLIEPWEFMIKYDEEGKESTVEICNADLPFNPTVDLEEKHLNKNSLNINVSTAAIETLFELVQLLTNQMQEANPYHLKNYTGFTITFWNSKSTAAEVKVTLEPNAGRDLKWQFFRQVKKKNKYVSQANLKSYIDLQIIEKEKKLDSLPSVQRIVSIQQEEEEMSEYKLVKQIDCDMMGKRFYRIKNRTELGTSPQGKKGGIHFVPFFAQKKVADQSSILMISSVHLDPKTGSKKIILRSPAILKNNLNERIKLRLVYKIKDTSFEEVIEETVEPNGKYYFPIQVIEEKTSIYLGAGEFGYCEKPLDLREILQERGPAGGYQEDVTLAGDDVQKREGLNTKFVKNKKDTHLTCKSGTETFNFALSILKRKVYAANPSPQGETDDNNFCDDTVIVVEPIISFINAVVRDIRPIFYDPNTPSSASQKEPPVVKPGNTRHFTETVYNDEIMLKFQLDGYLQTQGRKIFKKTEWTERFCLEFKPNPNTELKIKSSLFLWIEMIPKSTYSREIVIYCPYLIVNETNELLRYQEKTWGPVKLSEDAAMQRFESIKTKRTKALTFKSEIYSPKGGNHNSKPIEFGLKKNDDEGDDDFYGKIHMFSTSPKMNKLQISLKGTKNWSKSVSIQNAFGSIALTESLRDSKEREKEKNGGLKILGKVTDTWNNVAKYLNKKSKKEQPYQRKKYEFGVKTESALGLFNRSKLIILTPRYAIKNECGMPIMIAQYDQEIHEDIVLKIKHNCWGFFHWTDHKKAQEVVMSLADTHLQKAHGWSGKFYLNTVGESVVKLRQDPKKENLRGKTGEELYYARVVIKLDASNFIIRILPEDQNNPPYRIRNFTTYDISFRQKPSGNTKDKKANSDTGFHKATPGKKMPFAWDELTGLKFLEIMVEGELREYPLDTIKDYEPIRLGGEDKPLEEQKNDRSTLKKGYLGKKKAFDEDFEEQYCVLSTLKQRLKIYNQISPNIKEKILLKNARIEDIKETRFVLSVEQNKRTRMVEFKAKTEQDAAEWVEYIKRATFIHSPNVIHVKIEPVNSTKVITFQMTKDDKKDEEEDWLTQDQKKKHKHTSMTYKISINNVIGISIIDSLPRELLHITITKLLLVQTKLNEDFPSGENSTSHIGDVQGINSQWERETFFFSIDSIAINNQLHDTQFPVLLARNKKKTSNLPSLVLTYSSKNIKQSNMDSTLNYIFQFRSFLDTLEIRLDDFLISALISMYSQIPFVEDAKLEMNSNRIYDSKPLEAKLDNRISMAVDDNKRIYIKYMSLDTIDLWFTFRNSPGHKFDQKASNLLTDFGLSLVSLDSAKIRLNHLAQTHIFGSKSEVVSRITKHYSKQFWTQLYKLFGSIEILGNPVSLIENLGIGVVELFYEPLHTLVAGKSSKFGQSLAYGVGSFVSHSVKGISETINKIIRSLAGGLATMSADKEYLLKRQRQRNRRVRTIKEGFVFGMKNALETLWDTLIGIFTKPWVGAKKRGFFGFFQGIYSGIVSIFIKPIVALYDLAITLIQGVKNSAMYEEHIMDTRTRPPRLFGENNLIQNYDWGAATAKDVIRRIKSAKAYDHEEVLFYDEIAISKLARTTTTRYQIVLTDMRFLYAKKYNNLSYTQIKLYKIKSVKYIKEKNLLEFTLLVPLKNNKYKLTFPYQSYERAKPLLAQFSSQHLLEESQIIKDQDKSDLRLSENS